MGIMDKLGFGGSSSGNSTPGSGNTSLQESLEQFLKSPKVEDAKVKMNEAMTKAKETASSVAKKSGGIRDKGCGEHFRTDEYLDYSITAVPAAVIPATAHVSVCSTAGTGNDAAAGTTADR